MLLFVKIKPNQRFEKIESSPEGDWVIRINAPAIDGKANKRLREFLAQILDIAPGRISLKKGETARIKCLEIDAGEAFVLEKLRLASAGGNAKN